MRGKRFFTLGRTKDARGEMQDELEFHREARVAQLVARGMSEADARREVERRLAPVAHGLGDSADRKARRLALAEWGRDFLDDLRYALRGLRRQRAFTAIAVLTLALGIGGNTAIYTAVDALLLRALPYPEPERLMDISQVSPEVGPTQWSWPRFTFYRDAQKGFGSLAVYGEGNAILTGTDPERITIEEVSARYLSTLGVRVARGADFDHALDGGPGAPRVAIISDALWQRRFNADPAVVGRTVLIDNAPWEVVGVLPPGFKGLSGRAEALVNVTARASDDLMEPWGLEFSMIGRLAPGVSPAAAMAETKQVGPRIYQAFPMREGSLTSSARPQDWGAEARPLDAIRVSPVLRKSLLVLFGAVGLVLLIACVNLANLLVARGVSRRQEIAVRLAIGARRGRLVRLLVTESLALAMLGGLAGLGVAWLGTRALAAVNPRDTLRVQGLEGGIGAVSFETVQFDGRAMLFALGATLLVGIVFGLWPAWRATRSELVGELKEGGGRGAGRLGPSRRTLVVTEVALAVVLLAGSGLMIRSLANLLAVDPGFDPSRVLTLRLSVVPGTFAPDSMPGFYDQVQASIAAVPGVEGIALADCPPLNNGCNGTIMTFADRPTSVTGNAIVGVHWASPSWFRTLKVPLKRGRLFDDTDRLGGPRVVVINEAAARQYFPGEDPIGKRVAVYQGGFDKGAEVVGIVGDVRFGTIDSTARPDVFISYGQARIPRMMIFVRTSGDPLLVAGPVREALRRVAPTFPVHDVRTLDSRVAAAGSQARVSAILLAAFATMALALAVMGIYGVMSFAVAQRTREIGIRMALGAGRGRVLSLVMGETARLAGLGLAMGVVAALAFTRVLRSMLYEVSPSDPVTYLVMGSVLVFTALVAGWVPARRAARVDPAGSLRRE